MDIRQVVIIIDVNRFSKEDVIKDIQSEGYQHNFFFANYNDMDKTIKHIEDADEVWVWGECKFTAYYKLAKEIGADIWQMKV